MMLFNRRKKFNDALSQQQAEAQAALEQSQQDYEALQWLKPVVEDTVRRHRRLQLENHFAERVWYAYRGDA